MHDLIRMLSAQGRVVLSALRVVVAAILAHHGWMHVTGEAGGFFSREPFPLPDGIQPILAFLELGGGFLLLLGLFSRYLAVLFAAEFALVLYTAGMVKGLGWAGMQYPLLMFGCVLLIATNGAGTLALDRALKRWDA